MRCIQCGYTEDKVVDSRMSREGSCIRRRRECLRCGYRYTTYEQLERTELRVVKRSNVHEALNREKILRGMIEACEKRPVSMEQLDAAADGGKTAKYRSCGLHSLFLQIPAVPERRRVH